MKELKINARLSKKSRRVRKIISSPIRTKPKFCKHKLYKDYEAGEMVCLKCYEIVDAVYEYEHCKIRNNDILIWNRDYDKERWIKDTLEYINGWHNDAFNDMLWLEILQEIPNPCTWSQVYHVFHRNRLTDYWTCFPSYVGLPSTVSKTVLTLTLKYSDLGYTKYRVSFLYLFYKFTQMYDSETAKYIPFKGTKSWIRKTDKWWKDICEHKGWSYYPSQMQKLCWNKDYIVTCLSSIVKSYEHL